MKQKTVMMRLVLLVAVLIMCGSARVMQACATDPDTGGCTAADEGKQVNCPAGKLCITDSEGCSCH